MKYAYDRRAEVRLRRAVAPRCYTLWRLRRWSWNVTFFRADSDDRRTHMIGEGGHTFTAWGAALAAGRAVRAKGGDAR